VHPLSDRTGHQNFVEDQQIAGCPLKKNQDEGDNEKISDDELCVTLLLTSLSLLNFGLIESDTDASLSSIE